MGKFPSVPPLFLLALLPLAASAETKPGFFRFGAPIPGFDWSAAEGSDFNCTLDMSVVFPSINYTSSELPCTTATAQDGPDMCKNLTGKVALIVGGSTGIGRGTADRLVKAGMTVLGTSRSPEKYTQDCAPSHTFQSPGDMCKPVGFELWQLDVTNQTSVEELIKRVKETVGHIDFLFLNAGRSINQELFLPSTNQSDFSECQMLAQLQAATDVTLWGVVRVLMEALPLLSPDGYILATSSAAAIIPLSGTLGYSLSKHGVAALAEEWMIEHHPNATQQFSTLYPSIVRTNIWRNGIPNACMDEAEFSQHIDQYEKYWFQSPDIPVMTATQAGEAVYRMVVSPRPPLRMLMAPELAVSFIWKRMCRHMTTPQEAWVPVGWDRVDKPTRPGGT